jgi:hypothetical protein
MVDVPRQDWSDYEARARGNDVAWVRGLTPSGRFALYEELFGIVWGARRDLGNWERLDRWHWHQKIAMRLRLVKAFMKLDELHCERTAAHDSEGIGWPTTR